MQVICTERTINIKGLTGSEQQCICDQVQASHKWPNLNPIVTIMQIDHSEKPKKNTFVEWNKHPTVININ